MNKEYIKRLIEGILEENDIYGIVQIYHTDKFKYEINIICDYEEYLKLVCLSETEITDKMNITIDFTIRDE